MQTNMLKANVTISGIRPLLWNHFSEKALPLSKTEKKGVAGNNPEEWEETVLYDKNKQLYLEPIALFACIRDGAKYTRKGRSSLQPQIAATLQVLDAKVFVDRYLPDKITKNLNENVYLDVRSVKNPTTRGRNIRYRVAAKPGWKLSFNITWDKTIINREQMNSVINDAGMYCGLGDGRGIGFGRFEVEEFRLEDDA